MENDPETSNRPVWGATVCTYEGDGPTGSRGGKIPKPVDCGVTKQDGSFTVRALYAADTSVAGSNFLAICAGVRDNSKDCWLRELYLLSTRDSYDNFHFSIDAPPLIPKNKRINSVAQAPKELDYMNRENFLACETGTLKAGASAEKDGALNYTNKLFAKGGVVAPVLLLKKATDYYKETTWSPSSKAADDFPDAKEISGESLEGRLDAKKALDLRAVGELIHATVGTYFSEITTPKEGAAAEKLPTCQQLKECNETISSTTNKSNCNSQKSGAPGTHLASPITVRTLYYLISPTLRKKIPVCTEKGKTMFLSQVEPPWEYDPHHSKYPLSARYFPYQKLLTFDPAAIVKEREFVEATNDSYENDKGNVGGCRVVKFPDDSLFKKDGQRQDRAWADCDNSIHPATTGAELSTVMLNFLTTEKILAYSDIPEFGGPPTAALSTPTRPFGAKNPDLKTKFKGGYYRIGLQERLCNCSVTMDRNCADPINKIVFTTNEADTTNKYSSGYEFVTERSAETATAKGWLGWLNRKKGVEYFRDPINPVAKFIGFVYDMFTSWAANLGNWDKTYGACVNESQVAFCDTASDRYCRVETYTATSEDAGEYTETKYFTKLKTSPYQCSSEIKHPLNTRVEIPKTFNLDPGPSVQELYEPLTEPKVVSFAQADWDNRLGGC
ncbi:MAG: hypothetical protein UX73_C0034G0003 [candidate division WWE3 bacterium GW2011_GWC1_47_10]|uniref:Uncharacterized protein n=1 Tax=candidate division WWE3 bacterium GW2011_GWC1_47_10 TaxID=1619122 RepID=A0A0G1QX39_UNCKA|nr:MAG: hypothetical protein UX73_C0034G0003 [candidate division WWE3 bacterium GW2011_GWC1_47_10]